MSANRSLPEQAGIQLRNAINFRPIQSLRPVLFRSDHLASLDADDARQLETLGIRRVLDFRGTTERLAAPCALGHLTVHSLAIEPTIIQKITDLMNAGHRLSPADAVELMMETYRGFVRGNTPRFKQMFHLLLESDEPTVFHCTAGKDRTGFASALVLRSVGASAEDVMRDFLLSNERMRPPEASRHGFAPEVQAVLLGVRPEFLLAAFGAVEQDYGGLEGYFREGLGLREAEFTRLRELYLPPPRG